MQTFAEQAQTMRQLHVHTILYGKRQAIQAHLSHPSKLHMKLNGKVCDVFAAVVLSCWCMLLNTWTKCVRILKIQQRFADDMHCRLAKGISRSI